MHVRLKLFALLRDRAGASDFALDLPRGTTAGGALDYVAKQFPSIANLLPKAAIAVNLDYAQADRPLSEGDELALIPPVSGGAW
jgi:molybdopterin converting factor subunit 1